VAITRPLARYDGEIGGLPWRGEDDTGDAAQQRGKPVCQRRIVDLDRYTDDWRGFLAHRSGLSPIVSLKFTGSSARRTATSMTEPTLSGPSARRSARTPESFSLFQETITSPCRMPAAAEGPVLSTLITMAPMPSSSFTGCRPSPR